MSETLYTFDTIQDFIGKELGVSDWLPVEQEVMNRFAEDTRDPDWMHIDPVRARREGPFGGTVAFGFWTLSMLTYFSYQLKLHPEDAAYAVNYGLDRVRWIAPVPVGSRIRCRATLLDARYKDRDRIVMRTRNLIEIETREQPAMEAVWLGMLVRA